MRAVRPVVEVDADLGRIGPPRFVSQSVRALKKQLAGRRHPPQLGHLFILLGIIWVAPLALVAIFSVLLGVSAAILLNVYDPPGIDLTVVRQHVFYWLSRLPVFRSATDFLTQPDYTTRILSATVGAPFACALLAGPSIFLFGTGARLLNRNVEKVLRETGCQPILYLRPFYTDDWALEEDESNFDEALGASFRTWGPIIAVARPGEWSLGLKAQGRAIHGMSRDYYSDAEWQNGVSRRMEQALMIILVSGPTEGLQWEIEEIIKRGHLTKLCILQGPGRKRDRRGFDQFHAEMMEGVLRLVPGCESIRSGDLLGVAAMYFDASGALILLRSKLDATWDYRRVAAFVMHGMFCSSGQAAPARRLQSSSMASPAMVASGRPYWPGRMLKVFGLLVMTPFVVATLIVAWDHLLNAFGVFDRSWYFYLLSFNLTDLCGSYCMVAPNAFDAKYVLIPLLGFSAVPGLFMYIVGRRLLKVNKRHVGAR